jgi:uncharacterized protein YwgA
VLVVIALCGAKEEFGRTSLQKVTFLASLRLGIKLGHRAYYYGPYSAEVEADVEALVLGGLVTETVELLDFVRPNGFQASRYHYSVTGTGDARMRLLREAHPEQVDMTKSLVEELVRVAGSLDQNILAAAAKTLYIAREQGASVSAEEIKEVGNDFGWKLSTGQIKRAANVLESLQFVT